MARSPQSVLIPAIRWIVSKPRLANAMYRFEGWGNPFAPEFVADPMILADQMRADGPVAWRNLYQQWFVMGYDEVRDLLSSPNCGTESFMDVVLDVPPYTKLTDQARSLLANFLLLTDPPKHSRLRGLVNRAFTPRQVARLDERMGNVADELIADFDDREIDLVAAFAVPFPASIIADLFGLPADERAWLRKHSVAIAEVLDVFRGFDPDRLNDAVAELHQRIVALAAERRVAPRDDLITGLALAEADDGDRLSEDELVAVAVFILIAGHETTSMMIANSMLMLDAHRDQLALVREKPELWPNAVDELLRYDTSVRTIPRTALRDFELGGKQIKKGQNLVAMMQLANRDQRRHDDPDVLRLDRSDPSPISFGHGIHYCLGANLAKAELRCALPRLVDALGDFSIDRSKVVWRPSLSLRGPDHLPIERGQTPFI